MPAKILSNDQLDGLLGYVTSRKAGDPLRDRVIILLSFRAGLRAAEIAKLDWSDVTDATGALASILAVRPGVKCGKGRCLPMHPSLREALQALYEAMGAPTSGPVIQAQDGGPMQPNTLQRYYSRLATAAGLYGVSSHSGRRSFITTLAVQNPGKLRSIQKMAGHADVGTTVLYIDADADAAMMISGL